MLALTLNELCCCFPGCTPKNYLDIVFVLDTQSSDYNSRSHHIWRIVREIISRLNMDKGNIRIQFVSECSPAKQDLNSGHYMDKEALLFALKDIGEPPRRTAQLLSNMIAKFESHEEMESDSVANRRKVGLYLTDGHSGDFETVQRIAEQAKGQNNIEIFGMGIGDDIDINELTAVTSCQHPFHMFGLSHRESGRLTDAARKIVRQLCSHVYGKNDQPIY